jgi:hypothetical protein
MHTDRAAYIDTPDYLLLFLAKKAPKGGISTIASAAKIY